MRLYRFEARINREQDVAIVVVRKMKRRLLTLRGAELLQEADVIVHDRLVNEELLKHAKQGAELI